MSRTRLLLTLLLTIVPALLGHRESRAQTPTGKEFAVVLPALIPFTEAQKAICTYRIEVMCSRKTQVFLRYGSVNYFPNGVTVNAGDRIMFQNEFPLPDIWEIQQPSLQLNHGEVNNRVIIVSADQPITVQMSIDTLNRMETYSVFPVTAYDTSYTLASMGGYSQHSERGGFVVVAAQDGTVVRYTPRVQTWAGQPQNVEQSVTLNKYQAVSVRSRYRSIEKEDSTDMTGTIIRSNKPIGVLPFSYTNTPTGPIPRNDPPQQTNPPPPPAPQKPFPEYGWYGKPVMEMQYSDSAAGTLFYTLPFMRQDSSMFRIVATRNGTTVDTNGVPLSGTLNKGDKRDFVFKTPMKVQASLPVVALQFGLSGGAAKNDTIYSDGFIPDPDTVDFPYGAPMMMQVIPVNRYSRAVQWITPNLIQRPTLPTRPPGNHAWEHYAVITAPINTSDTVMLDESKKVLFSHVHSDGNYVSTVYRMTPRQHVVEAEEPISVMAYGFEWDDAYGFNAGEALRSRAKFGMDSLRFISCENELDTIITVENLGNNTFLIDSIKGNGLNIKVLTPIEFPWQYQPGTRNNLVIVLRTPTPGTYSGSIRIFTDANNRKVWDIPVVAVRDSAQLAVPSSTIDFGVVKSTTPSIDTCILVRNTGARPLTIDGAAIVGGGFTVLEPKSQVTLPPGDSLCIRVRFAPTGDGLIERTLRIVGSPCLKPVDIAVRGFKGGGASLSVQRALNYPAFLCDAPDFVDSTIILKSIGDEPVEITSATFTGNFPGDYSFPNGSPQGQTIAPGTELPVIVRFVPTGYGSRDATLSLTTNAANAPTLNIDLRARHDTAMLIASVPSLDFRTVRSCDDTVRMSVTITNDGTVADTITSIDLGGGTAYGIEESLPLIVYPGVPREITVRFAPQSEGSFPTTLRAIGTPCGSEAQVTLTGRRIAPSLTSETPSLDFGTVYVCEGDTTLRLTLTNDGEVADTITGAQFNGSPAFLLQESFPIVLEPGTSRSFAIRFTPNNAGTYSGQLQFAWGPCEMTTTVDVTGTAVEPATEISEVQVEFGTVNIGQSARRVVTLRNSGAGDRTISASDVSSGEVRVIRPAQWPVTILSGESVEIELEYTPKQKGEMTGKLTLTVNDPCGRRHEALIAGTAVGDEVILAGLVVGTPTGLTGNVGERASIPVMILNSTNLEAASVTGMTIRLHHRYTMFLPQQVKGANGLTATYNSRIEGDDRVIDLVIEGGTFPTTGTIATIEGLVLLGDTTCTAVIIDSVGVRTPPNRVVTASAEHGTFCSDGYCEIGGDRLVSLDGGIRLKPAVPNPFREQTKIEFTVTESGPVDLVVVDMLGRPVQRLVGEVLGAGTHQVEFDGRTLPSGLYFCELRRGETVLRHAMLLSP